MMRAQEKDKKSRRGIIVAALIATLAVNLLLMALFDYSPPPPLKVPIKPFRTVMLDLSAPQRHWHHEVSNWLLYQNPSLTSRPDYRFGYSRAAQTPPYREMLPVLRLAPPELTGATTILPFEPLRPTAYPQAPASLAELQGLRTIDPRSVNVVYPQIEVPRYPLVVADGRPLRKIRFEGVEVPPGSKPTRLRMSAGAPGMLPRVMITASSGDATLDRKAVRGLLEYAGQSPPDAGSSHELVVYWLQDGDGS